MTPTLNDLKTFAYGAGEILLSGYGHNIQIDYKSEIDLVTNIDRQSEDYLVAAIEKKFPGHQIVTEESGIILGDAAKVWFIDPIDGTVNYAHGIPIFAVSIAYAENGQIQAGVVYNPLQNQMFSAQRGVGVWQNGTPIQVSRQNRLDRSLLVTGFPYDIRTRQHNNLDNYTNLSLKSQGVRRLGSAAIDLAYVAAGYFDGFWEISIHSWDIAAGILMVEEAGGRVTDVLGGNNPMGPSPSIIATNGLIHDQLTAELNHR